MFIFCKTMSNNQGVFFLIIITRIRIMFVEKCQIFKASHIFQISLSEKWLAFTLYDFIIYIVSETYTCTTMKQWNSNKFKSLKKKLT